MVGGSREYNIVAVAFVSSEFRLDGEESLSLARFLTALLFGWREFISGGREIVSVRLPYEIMIMF